MNATVERRSEWRDERGRAMGRKPRGTERDKGWLPSMGPRERVALRNVETGGTSGGRRATPAPSDQYDGEGGRVEQLYEGWKGRVGWRRRVIVACGDQILHVLKRDGRKRLFFN